MYAPVKHVGLVHGTFPRVQFMERTPGHAACGGCGGFRSGHAIEHDIFRIIVVEQQFVRAFRHGDPSSFIGQIALYTLSVAGIDLDTYSVGRSRTQIFIVVLPVLFPQFFPVIGVSTFPFLFPVGREIHLHGKTMLVVVVTQVFPAARGKECQSCKRKPMRYIVALLSSCASFLFIGIPQPPHKGKLQFQRTEVIHSVCLLVHVVPVDGKIFFVLAVHVPRPIPASSESRRPMGNMYRS